jgi:hypothetical protein
MRLFHFTSLRALVGEEGEVETPEGGVSLAAGMHSILYLGLLPVRLVGWPFPHTSPLEPCVWLVDGSNDQLDAPYILRSAGIEWRVTVQIPDDDPRLWHWRSYLRAQDLEAVPGTVELLAAPPCWVFFGRIPPVWITAIQPTGWER